MILQGLIAINGKVVCDLGVKADPYTDHIKVANRLITRFEPLTYVLLNKPKGFISTCSDPSERRTVTNIVKDIKVTLKPVGRLDCNTEGLLLLTNDGEMIHSLTHPRFKVEKTYLAKVKGIPSKQSINDLKKGVRIGKVKTLPAKVRVVRVKEKNCWIEITITEGKNLQIRRMGDAILHPVLKLIRIRYAFLNIKHLEIGEYRHLTEKEVERLKSITIKDK